MRYSHGEGPEMLFIAAPSRAVWQLQELNVNWISIGATTHSLICPYLGRWLTLTYVLVLSSLMTPQQPANERIECEK